MTESLVVPFGGVNCKTDDPVGSVFDSLMLNVLKFGLVVILPFNEVKICKGHVDVLNKMKNRREAAG